jgi:hypothetical protein
VILRSVPVSRAAAKEIVKRLRHAPDAALLRAAAAARDRQLGWEILRAAPRAIAAASRTDVEAFAAGMRSWGEVDCFACFAGGVAWRLGVIGDADVARWMGWAPSWNGQRRRRATRPRMATRDRATGDVTGG